MPGLAVAIVHKGRVVFAEGFGIASAETKEAITPDTVFQVGSVGKMLTAAAVLDAAADGRLALNEPIARKVSGLDTTIGALTPHELLAQISGIRDMPGAHGELGDEAHGRFLRTLTARDTSGATRTVGISSSRLRKARLCFGRMTVCHSR